MIVYDFKIRDAKTAKTEITVTPSQNECVALAEHFDLVSVSDCVADFVIDQLQVGELFHVKMSLKAKAKIALPLGEEVLEINVADEEEDLFTTREDLIAQDDEEDLDINAPALIEKGTIDLGEMISDYLFLMIDEEFRRLTGGDTVTPEQVEEMSKKEETRRPFANLQEMLDAKK